MSLIFSDYKSKTGFTLSHENTKYLDLKNLGAFVILCEKNVFKDLNITSTYSANNLNQYSSVTSASSAVTNLGYDSNGNLINGGTIQSGLFFYDAQNRLTRAVVSGNTTDFDYDSKNRVVKRSLNSVPTFLIYDGWSLIEERTSTGSVSARYVHGTQIDEILTKTDSAGTIYYHHDALGSVTQITNAIGTMIEKYLYDIFGKVTMLALSGAVLTTSSRGNRFFFTGRERIESAGIYDYRNRVYSETLGRFLQTDPIRFNAGDVNLYRYCGNDGVNKIDPVGLYGGVPALVGIIILATGEAISYFRAESGDYYDSPVSFLMNISPLGTFSEFYFGSGYFVAYKFYDGDGNSHLTFIWISEGTPIKPLRESLGKEGSNNKNAGSFNLRGITKDKCNSSFKKGSESIFNNKNYTISERFDQNGKREVYVVDR